MVTLKPKGRMSDARVYGKDNQISKYVLVPSDTSQECVDRARRIESGMKEFGQM